MRFSNFKVSQDPPGTVPSSFLGSCPGRRGVVSVDMYVSDILLRNPNAGGTVGTW